MPDTYAKNYGRLAKIAKDNNLVLNPYPERVRKVVGLMANNYDLDHE